MRVWLDPEKVASRGLTASDVVNAVREQNVQVAAGQLGAPPVRNAADFQLTINIKSGSEGAITRLRDVARIELGADSYALRSLLDNKSAVAVPVFQRPGS